MLAIKRIFLLLVLLLVVTVVPTWAQFSFTKPAKLVLAGQLVDARSGEPLVEATVTIRTQYGDTHAKTDNTGNFLMEVADKEGLKNCLIFFSHPDYREKDVNGLLAATFADKAKMMVKGSGDNVANIKYKKDDLKLDCNGQATLATKDGKLMKFQTSCNDKRRLTLTLVNGSQMTFASSGSDINLTVDGLKAKLEYSNEEPAYIEIKALMFKR